MAVASLAASNIAKAALIQLTRTLVVDYLEQGIRANVLVMGGAPTAAAARAVAQVTSLVHGAAASGDAHVYVPTPLTGTALRDVATTMCALADDDMRAVTGATIALDQAQSAGSLYSAAIFHVLSGGWQRP